jgi:lipopolysaccharide biosynthesis protein
MEQGSSQICHQLPTPSDETGSLPAPSSVVRPIAFYLPQFHPVRENSDWWGEGFTEWTNVAKARPNFEGHQQPHIPKDLGFYDLRMPEAIQAQATLARQYSIYGFCFYFYWFSGRRILHTPIDVFCRAGIDMKFCFCWANENWTKRWDGGDNEILLASEHSIENDNQFIEDVIPYMKDDRYILCCGCPMLLVYRADLLTDSKRTFAHWRRRMHESGFLGLFIACVDHYGNDRPGDFGADALVEFPPHQYIKESFCDSPTITNRDFQGHILDYRMVMAQSINNRHEDFLLFPGVMPSWDNTARRQNAPDIFLNSSPELFEFWLRHQAIKAIEDKQNAEKFLFINAWNEWAEGCHLEPCLRYGHRHLEAVRRAIRPDRYLTPVPPHDSIVGALAAINSYSIGDAKYFSGLEVAYRSAISEISSLRKQVYARPLRKWGQVGNPNVLPLPVAVADRLRSRPLMYRTARFGYRLTRLVGLVK